MSEAREAILARVRTALSDRPAPADIPWRYGADVGTGDLGLVERFVERVADYRARVDRVAEADADRAIGAALRDARTVIGDPAVQARWPGAAPWVSDTGLSADALDAVDAVVTTATVAIANTGTLVLDHGPGQGRRALSLVPDVHVCVVRVSQIVDDVPNAVARLVDSGSHTRPLTWISGPSATSDIELDRVEGVHGPRTLHVIVLG
ncbi:lactate utilization protein C [Mycolicibacterium obuense]|uniref:Lactate utilization protein C n=1 Tax=Mycolicibacterium obuense TaxID=1807 RepID=A0A4R5X4Z4_9MYCO|nr:lactate utilization protein C [Mycolicibacterium obuense]TDL05803.1 lactate utilization protein C [Mycolicibacterium obuense]